MTDEGRTGRTARTVTLVLASGPGFPEGSPQHRYEIALGLDAQGRPDPRAWAEDPAPWPARRFGPDQPDRVGDVHHDPDGGWSLRFFGAGAEAPDAPLHHLLEGAAEIRPGEYLTIREPDGRDYSYRIVSVD